MNFKGLRIVFKAERAHGIQNVLPSYRLPLFQLALLCCLRRYEGDKLGHALLDTFLRVLRNLGGGGNSRLHDARNIGNLLRN